MKVASYNHPVVLVSALALLSLSPLSASAQWGVGFSAETVQSMYKTDNDDKELMIEGSLSVEYQGERFNIEKGVMSYEVIKADKYSMDVVATSYNSGYQAKDKHIFKGMKERMASLDVGMRLRAKTPYIPISLALTKDVYKNKGTQVGLSLGGIQSSTKHWTGKRSVSVAPILGADWQSTKVVDYYYGVKDSEATAKRTAFKGKSAVIPFIGFETEARLSKHFSLSGGAKYKRLPSAISDSSLTKNGKDDFQLNLGVNYWF